jgi:hypothetical protein
MFDLKSYPEPGKWARRFKRVGILLLAAFFALWTVALCIDGDFRTGEIRSPRDSQLEWLIATYQHGTYLHAFIVIGFALIVLISVIWMAWEFVRAYQEQHPKKAVLSVVPERR